MDKIEDTLFAKALEAKGIKRTKDMYEKATYPHICSMCQDENSFNQVGYKLKTKCIRDFEEPYLFICEECWSSLPSDTKESN